MPDARAAGQIFDIGYQHYDGPRLGRGHGIWTLITFSFRSAFGEGRGARGRIIPLVVIALVYLPVVIQIVIAAVSGQPDQISYARQLEFVGLFIALFTAAQAPEVIVTDRQFGVLPLYMSRSIRSTDYAIAKLLSFVGALLVLTLGPELALFLGKILLSATPWTAFRGEWKSLGPILGGTVLAALYVATIGLALASLAARRAYASAAVIAFFILMPALAGISRHLLPGDAARYATLGSPFQVMTGFAQWLFDVQAGPVRVFRGRRALAEVISPVPGYLCLYVMLGTCVAGIALLAFRFRSNEE
ncbi:MAG TPA: hypothetical protein VMH39_03985 [Gemmatimonadaceae bacterium]|nr:hypothetical protein [Gemmatimonadaceae bacterium]